MNFSTVRSIGIDDLEYQLEKLSLWDKVISLVNPTLTSYMQRSVKTFFANDSEDVLRRLTQVVEQVMECNKIEFEKKAIFDCALLAERMRQSGPCLLLKKGSELAHTLFIQENAFYIIYGTSAHSNIDERKFRNALYVPFSGEKPTQVAMYSARERSELPLSKAELTIRHSFLKKVPPTSSSIRAFTYTKEKEGALVYKNAAFLDADNRYLFVNNQLICNLVALDTLEDALMTAVRENDVDSVYFLKDSFPRLKNVLLVALNNAAEAGSLDIVRILLTSGFTSGKLRKAILSASMNGHVEVVWHLLGKDTKNIDIAFCGAARGGQIELLEFLSHFKELTPSCNKISFVVACAHNQEKAAIWLMANGFVAKSSQQQGFIAALENNNIRLARLIFETGFVTQHEVAMVFVAACESKSLACVKVVHHFLGPLPQMYMQLALEKAVGGADSLEVVKYLIPFLKSIYSQGENALLLAAGNYWDDRSEEVVILLARRGASVNSIDKAGKTPLQYAQEHGWYKAEAVLKERLWISV